MSVIKGKQYILLDERTGSIFYNGSTCCSLEERFSEHKRSMKREREKQRPLYEHMTKIGIENCQIQLFENFACSSKDELREREGEITRKLIDDGYEMKNVLIAGRSYEEFKIEERQRHLDAKKREYVRHRNKYLERSKLYRENNPEKVKKYMSEYYINNKKKFLEKVQCSCGTILSRTSLTRHKKTVRHQTGTQCQFIKDDGYESC